MLHHFRMTTEFEEGRVHGECFPLLGPSLMKKPHQALPCSSICLNVDVHLHTMDVAIVVNWHKFGAFIGITAVDGYLSELAPLL